MADGAESRALAAAHGRGEASATRQNAQVRLARTLLVVLAFVLPFEAPLFRLGPLQITTVELVLYATLAAWGFAIVFPLPVLRNSLRAHAMALAGDPMVRAAGLWFAALLASGLAAPSYRAAALKFTLRSLSGILLFLAARTLVRSPEMTRRVLVGIVTGALVSAGTAVLEWLVPSTASIWRPFRQGSFDVLGLPRPSGAFAYPTIGAMYWEAAVPLALVLPFLWGGVVIHRMRASTVAIVGSAALVAAILASATRSGLAGTAIGCAALYVLGRRLGPDLRRAAAGGVLVVTVSWALVQALSGFAGSLLAARLTWWRDEDWLRAECTVGITPEAVRAGQPFAVSVTLQNRGSVRWERSGARSVQLSYHWRRLDGRTTAADFEGIRTPLPSDVAPGGSREVLARVRAPARPGAYRLQWDLVEEGITWFSQRGHAMAEEDVAVEPPLVGTQGPALGDLRAAPSFAPDPPPRSSLWRAAIALWRERPVLGIGPDNFRRRYEAVLSPSPSGQPYTDTRIHANSLYFETLADLGIAGVLALGALAFAIGRNLRRQVVVGATAGIGCGLAAAVFFVHGVFDYFLEFTPLFALFWLLLGLTAAQPTPGAHPDSPA